jgi:hypothetical protein
VTFVNLDTIPGRIEKVLESRDKSTNDQTQTIVNLGKIQAELRAMVELTRLVVELLLYVARSKP